jgi:hypothetical protein
MFIILNNQFILIVKKKNTTQGGGHWSVVMLEKYLNEYAPPIVAWPNGARVKVNSTHFRLGFHVALVLTQSVTKLTNPFLYI